MSMKKDGIQTRKRKPRGGGGKRRRKNTVEDTPKYDSDGEFNNRENNSKIQFEESIFKQSQIFMIRNIWVQGRALYISTVITLPDEL